MSSKPDHHSDVTPLQTNEKTDFATPSLNRVPTSGAPVAIAEELAHLLAPAEAAGEVGRLGHFRVLGILGAGGMGIVLQAVDALLHRPAALKVIWPVLACDTVAVERFLREARAAAGVRHRHVVTVYEVGLDRGVPFLAMELLRGTSLDERLKNGPDVSLSLAVRIARQVAEGLAAAHDSGLIHRDVKPSNIWLEDPHDEVKILDFGLARLAQDDLQLTRTGTVVGSPHYMAPEQARGEDIDFRCDLFSLGSVLYQLVTRRPPFRGTSLTAVLTSLAVESPVPPESLNQQIPLPLAALIKQLLAKDPADRPGSGDEVAQRLAAIEPLLTDPQQSSLARAATGSLSPPPIGSAEESPRTTRSRQQWAWLIGSAAVVVLACVAWAAWSIWGSGDGKDRGPTASSKSGVTTPGLDSKGNSGDTATSTLKASAPVFPPLDSEWVKIAIALSPKEQVNAVVKELDRRNPGFLGSGSIEIGFKNDQNTGEPVAVIGLKIPADKLVDLSPLRVLTQLENLNCSGSGGTRAPLKDLSPLAQSPLRDLHLPDTSVTDLVPLTNMPLQFLDLTGTPVSDLTPLKDQMQLNSLHLRDTSVVDLKPLARMPLKVLDVRKIPAKDLGPLSGLPLEELEVDFDRGRHTELLKSLPKLRQINGERRDEFLKSAAKTK